MISVGSCSKGSPLAALINRVPSKEGPRFSRKTFTGVQLPIL